VINVKVEGGAGTPAQNTDLAEKIGTSVEAAIDRKISAAMREQMRPGGMLYGRGGR
jgi:hypothetical protein